MSIGSPWPNDPFFQLPTSNLPAATASASSVLLWAPAPSGDVTGVTDRTALNALALGAPSGAQIQLQPGTYWFDLQVTLNNIGTLRGAGKFRTVLKMANAANLAVGIKAVSQIVISDLTIDGNTSNQTGGTVLLFFDVGSDRSTLRDCVIQNPFAEAVRTVTNDNLILGNDILAAGGNGIQVRQPAVRTRVIGNRVDTPGSAGILLGGGIWGGSPIAGPDQTTITANIIRNPGNIGIACGQNSSRTTITANIVSGGAQDGIDPGACIDTTVVGNTIFNTVGGIISDGSPAGAVPSGLVITGNMIRGSTTQGMSIGSSPGTLVTNNFVTDCGLTGIDIASSNNCSVTNNIVKNCSKSASGTTGCIRFFSCTRGLASGNVCFDDQGAHTTNAGVVLQSAAASIRVIGNDFSAGGFTTGSGINNNAATTNNFFATNGGHNPVGNIAPPAFPATGAAQINTSNVPITAYVANGVGAITQIAVGGQNTNTQIAASGWGTVRLQPGQSVTFTYAAGAPAWVWIGD